MRRPWVSKDPRSLRRCAPFIQTQNVLSGPVHSSSSDSMIMTVDVWKPQLETPETRWRGLRYFSLGLSLGDSMMPRIVRPLGKSAVDSQ